jgi:hypothetical protein
MPPTTLAEDSLNDRHQSCASRIHIPPLVFWQEKRPSGNPVRSFVDNLHKGRNICIVKYNIVSAIPYCPNQVTYTNSNPCLDRFLNPVQPLSKHVLYIVRGWHIESEVDYSPYEGGEFAFEKKVFNGLIFITKCAFFATIPAPFGQVVFG